jgi:hypothetical protein
MANHSQQAVSSGIAASKSQATRTYEEVVSLGNNPPGASAGELVAELVKDLDKQVQRAVENCRMVVERGGLVAD